MKLPAPTKKDPKHLQTLYHIIIEEWKPVPGFEGKYEVSTFGSARSLDRYVKKGNGHRITKGKTLSICKPKKGYSHISLGRNNRQLFHRIIALTFIPNPENKPCINHKDGNKLNNRVDNLEWCTYSENNIHARKVLGVKNGKRPLGIKKKNPKKIHCISDGNVFNCREDAADYYKINKCSITAASNGTRTSVKGLYFQYLKTA